jgi:hypothetical protein
MPCLQLALLEPCIVSSIDIDTRAITRHKLFSVEPSECLNIVRLQCIAVDHNTVGVSRV